MAAQKENTNAVGDQRNWEQRVISELDVAKAWCDTWGSLFEGARSQQQRISELEEAFGRIPGDRRTQTNYQLSFKGESPFDEYPVGPMQKKVLKMEDVEKLAEEMMATQQ